MADFAVTEKGKTMATLVERLRWWATECDRTNFGCQAKGMLLDAADALEKAEPVKHGRWIMKESLFEETVYRCSACEEDFVLLDGEPTDDWYNYCPNCGAKMDL